MKEGLLKSPVILHPGANHCLLPLKWVNHNTGGPGLSSSQELTQQCCLLLLFLPDVPLSGKMAGSYQPLLALLQRV